MGRFPFPALPVATDFPARIDHERRRFQTSASGALLGLTTLRYAPARADDGVRGQQVIVWQPRRDAAGRITEQAWADLPRRTWVEVTGSSPIPDLRRQLIDSGFTENNPLFTEATLEKHVRGSFAAWIGGCHDVRARSFYVPYGGGHADGGLNGIWKLDLQRMAWSIEKMPSHPAARGAEWSAAYLDRSSRGGGGNYTIYRTERTEPPRWTGHSVRGDGYCDVLPDLRPTSRHQYMGVVFDSSRNRLYTHRYRRLSYSTVDRTESDLLYDPNVLRWPNNGRPNPDPDNHAIFDPETDSTYLWSIGGGYWAFFRLHEPTYTLTRLPSLPAHASRIATMAQVGRELYFMNLGSNNNDSRAPVVSQRLDVFNLDRQQWTRTDTFVGYPKHVLQNRGEVWATNASDDMQSMVWIPETRKFLCYLSVPRKWYWLDPLRLTLSVFSGDSSPAPARHLGTKVFYCPVRKAIVLAAGLDHAMSMMGVHLYKVA